MTTLEALLPMLVVGGAFVAIIFAVKKRADAEDKDER